MGDGFGGWSKGARTVVGGVLEQSEHVARLTQVTFLGDIAPGVSCHYAGVFLVIMIMSSSVSHYKTHSLNRQTSHGEPAGFRLGC